MRDHAKNAMTAPSRSELPPWTVALYLLAIAVSVPFILFPAARSLPYPRIALGVFVVAVFVAVARRGMSSGDLTRTMPEIYAQARAGRRLAGPALETAAVVAICLAEWLTY